MALAMLPSGSVTNSSGLHLVNVANCSVLFEIDDITVSLCQSSDLNCFQRQVFSREIKRLIFRFKEIFSCAKRETVPKSKKMLRRIGIRI